MRRTTSDALKIIDRRFFRTKKARARLQEAEASAEIARQIYSLRTKAGLTQRELAKLVGTTHSVLSRLEDDDYLGHSLAMLRRIAAVFGKRVEIRFVKDSGSKTA